MIKFDKLLKEERETLEDLKTALEEAGLYAEKQGTFLYVAKTKIDFTDKENDDKKIVVGKVISASEPANFSVQNSAGNLMAIKNINSAIHEFRENFDKYVYNKSKLTPGNRYPGNNKYKGD